MRRTDTSALKKEITDKISKINDEETLKGLEIIVNELMAGNKDFWDELPEHIKNGIEVALKELADGKGIPHKEAMEKIKARYKTP